MEGVGPTLGRRKGGRHLEWRDLLLAQEPMLSGDCDPKHMQVVASVISRGTKSPLTDLQI